MYKLDSVYQIDSFWYIFGNPFLTTLVICVAVGICCLIVYICTILAIETYKKRKRLDSASNAVNIETIEDKKRKRLDSASNAVNIEAIEDFIEISGIENNIDNDNDKNNDKTMNETNVVESTFFLKNLGTLEEINAEIGLEINDFLPIAFLDTDDFFE